MLGTTATLMTRSLRQEARGLRGHLIRLLFVAIMYFFLLDAQDASVWRGAPGLIFFKSMTWINFIAICVGGASFFSTSITEEKEESTLGLLRMAGISPVSLLLGKSTSRLIAALFLLSLQFPFTLLAITLGGVTVHQVWAAYWALAAFLVMAANVGLFCSVVCRSSRSASWMAGLLLLFLLWLAPLLVVACWYVYLRMSGMSPAAIDVDPSMASVLNWLQQTSSAVRLDTIMSTGFTESALSEQVVMNCVIGLLFFGLGWALFDRVAGKEAAASPARNLPHPRARLLRRLRPGRAWQNALMWKDYHFMTGGKSGLLFRFLIYGSLQALVLMAILTVSFSGWPDWRNFDREEFGGWMMGSMLFMTMVEIALYAGMMFREEIQWKTLSSVMTLPMSPARIIASKIAGCLLGLIPALCYFALGTMIYPEGFFEGLEELVTSEEGWFFTANFLLVVHLTAFYSLWVRWSSLPLAFGTVFFINAGCINLFDLSPSSPATVLLAIMALLFCLVLQGFIRTRLTDVAAK